MKKKQTYIVLDVETTGLDVYKEKMIEFAAVKLVGTKITETFETLINPEQPIRHSSFLVHGISQEEVENQPTYAEIMPAILEFIGDYPLVGHNVIFDYSFINRASKNLYGKGIENQIIDSQAMFKEVFPEEPSHGLEALMRRMKVEFSTRHRAMADTMGLAQAFPKLKKLYDKKCAWQLSQCDNVPYLFERYLRVQNAIQVMQSELLDLKSIFKVYFESGGEEIISATGETLVYNSKAGYTYDFEKIRPCLDEIESINKVIKLNSGLLDRMISSRNLDDDVKEILRSARTGFCENKSVNIVKAAKNGNGNSNHEND